MSSLTVWQTMLTWLISGLPWFCGLLVGLRLATSRRLSSVDAIAVSAATALLAYLALAFLVLTVQLSGYSFFNESVYLGFTVFCLILIVRLYLFSFVRKYFSAIFRRKTMGLGALFLCCSLFCYSAISFFQISFVPTFGWDTLWYWTKSSRFIIDQGTSVNLFPWSTLQGHPPFVAIYGAWGAFGSYLVDGAGPLYAVWFFVWLSCILACTAYVYGGSRSITLALLSAIAIASVPLLTNHLEIGGYAELIVASTICCSVALAAVVFRAPDPLLIMLLIMTLLSLICFKNVGFFYSICSSFGLVFAFAVVKRAFRMWLCILTPLFLSLLLLLNSFSLIDPFAVRLSGRDLNVVFSNISLIPYNLYFSAVVNQSFSVVMIIFIISVLVALNPNNTMHAEDLISVVVSILVFLFLFISQFTDYGFAFAQPGSDTGNSRFSLAFIVPAIMSLRLLFYLSNTGRGYYLGARPE